MQRSERDTDRNTPGKYRDFSLLLFSMFDRKARLRSKATDCRLINDELSYADYSPVGINVNSWEQVDGRERTGLSAKQRLLARNGAPKSVADSFLINRETILITVLLRGRNAAGTRGVVTH